MKTRRLMMIAVTIWCLIRMFVFVPVYAQPSAPKTIKIGALYDITGPLAATGEKFGWGLKKGVEAKNKDGGLYLKEFDRKIPLELVEADHTAKEDKAVLQAEYLNDQGVAALIGTTAILPPGAAIIERYHLPTLVQLSSIRRPYELGYKYLFSSFPKSPDYARTFIALLNSFPKETRPVKIAIFEAMHDASVEACKYAEQEAMASGYKVARVKFGWLTKDMSGTILEAKKAGADAVYGMMITPDAMLMIRQMKELDYNPKAIFILQGAADRAAWGTLGKDGDCVYLSKDFHWSLGWPGAKELMALYEAERKEKPYTYIGFGYASIQIIANAINKAGTLDRKKIRDALAATDMMTVLGPTKFRADGTLDVLLVNVAQFQNGVEPMVFPEMWREKAPIYPAPQWKQR